MPNGVVRRRRNRSFLVAGAIVAAALTACVVSVGTVSGQEVKVSTSTTSVTAVAVPPGEKEPTTTVPGPCLSRSVTVTEPGQVQGSAFVLVRSWWYGCRPWAATLGGAPTHP